MASVFWDRKGVLMVEFMQQGTKITSEVYCETVKKLRRAIQNQSHGMPIYGVFLMLPYGSALPHTAARTRTLPEHFNWELFGRLPYSPDLYPSDYHVFICLKNYLGSQRFNNNEELMEGVKRWWSSQAADFFDSGKQKLIP
jgi:hypothetical protein